MKKMGIYVHIPFCISKCSYCDFASVPLNDTVERYFNALIKEITLRGKELKRLEVDTVFIGGGTPSSVDNLFIAEVMDALRSAFNISYDAEISMEANPGTLTAGKAKSYFKTGINRISLGIQSFDDDLLKSIGRIHTAAQAEEAIYLLREAGFENISGDFMLGLPGQTKESYLNDLDHGCNLGLSHISAYSLILEEGTLLTAQYDKGLISLPGEDEERSMYHEGVDLLKRRGLIQYEISNFATTEKTCAHNIGYWKLKPYIGIGLSAHSCLPGLRFWNTSEFDKYFEMIEKDKFPIDGEERINETMRASEFLILGIRMNEGINLQEFYEEFGYRFEDKYEEVINKHVTGGLLEKTQDYIRLTRRGFDLSNVVEVDLYK